MIDAEKVQHRGMQIVGVNAACGGKNAVFIGCPMHVTALHAATGHP